PVPAVVEAAVTWDALVIGAGPAGSVTARELARRGLRGLLVDKANFPRAKVCGCCLNAAAVATLRRLGFGHGPPGAVPRGRVPIGAAGHTACLGLPRGRALSRGAFDARLVDEAVKGGAEFRPHTPLSRDGGGAGGDNPPAKGGSTFNARITIL